MRIKPEMRGFYPRNWPEISRRIRFERARRHLPGLRPTARADGPLSIRRPMVRCRLGHLAQRSWSVGALADLIEMAQTRHTRVILAAAHLDHNPGNNRLRNMKGLCQRSHLIHDRPHHLARRRITYLLRRALGDLFFGPYSVALQVGQPSQLLQKASGPTLGFRNGPYAARSLRGAAARELHRCNLIRVSIAFQLLRRSLGLVLEIA